MKNKILTQSLSTFRIVLISSLTIFTLYTVQAWVSPTVSAPNGNVGGPLTTATSTQIKTGSLGLLDSLSIGKDLIVNGGFRFATTSAGVGKVLTTDAVGNANWTATSSLGISSGESHGKKRFTTVGAGTCPSATNCFTVPAGVTTVWVSMSGGGGGGACNPGSNGGYGGGGAGAVIAQQLTVTSGTGYPITVGGGGAGAPFATCLGGGGGASSFGSPALLTTNGGGGGGNPLYAGTPGVAGGPGGVAASAVGVNTGIGGGGGGSIFGAGAPAFATPALAGAIYGGGGSGASSAAVGAGGAQGFVLVEW